MSDAERLISGPDHRAIAPSWRAALGIFAGALALRAAAAVAFDKYAQQRGTLCLFADTNIYWHLAGALKNGAPYVVSQFGVPHWSLRAPGYPLFLAAVRALAGDSTLAARLAQAAICATTAPMMMRLVGFLLPGDTKRVSGRSAATWAGLIAALEPWSVGLSALLLSDALFVPLMVGGLLLIVSAAASARGRIVSALSAGAVTGATILVRPSWALFPAIAMVGSICCAAKGARLKATRRALLVAFGIVVVMAPWWYRNGVLYGRFVPTVLWFGASLYDGLNPDADGASDMAFLADPRYRELDEGSQDRVLRDDALAFARANPGRAVWLAAVKLGRFWSPWPNADELRSPALRAASALITVPIYLLILLGVWFSRRDIWLLVILLGPLVYFALIHAVFVGSIRYRIPAMAPAFGLAGIGMASLVGAIAASRRDRAGGEP